MNEVAALKALKLNWKRSDPQAPAHQAVYGPNLEAVYIAQGKVKVGEGRLLYVATIIKDKSDKKYPWCIGLKINGEPNETLNGAPTYSAAKKAIQTHLESIIDEQARAFAERKILIARIHAIYEAHGQHVMGKGFEGHTTSGLKKHLSALQAGKFPWKLAPRETPADGAAEASPAKGLVRERIAESTRNLVLKEVKASLEGRVKEKGEGAFVSLHELRGVLDEEWDELAAAMHSKDIKHVESELKDLIVGAVFGLACIRAGVLY